MFLLQTREAFRDPEVQAEKKPLRTTFMEIWKSGRRGFNEQPHYVDGRLLVPGVFESEEDLLRQAESEIN